MSGIPEPTAIRLTEAERAELKGFTRSTKTEYRLRQRARDGKFHFGAFHARYRMTYTRYLMRKFLTISSRPPGARHGAAEIGRAADLG